MNKVESYYEFHVRMEALKSGVVETKTSYVIVGESESFVVREGIACESTMENIVQVFSKKQVSLEIAESMHKKQSVDEDVIRMSLIMFTKYSYSGYMKYLDDIPYLVGCVETLRRGPLLFGTQMWDLVEVSGEIIFGKVFSVGQVNRIKPFTQSIIQGIIRELKLNCDYSDFERAGGLLGGGSDLDSDCEEVHICVATSNVEKQTEIIVAIRGDELGDLVLDCCVDEIEEIQGTSEDVIISKATKYFEILDRPLICEDSSLSVSVLGGLPGPYLKDFLKLDLNGVYALCVALDDYSAIWTSKVAVVDETGATVIYTVDMKVKMIKPQGPRLEDVVEWIRSDEYGDDSAVAACVRLARPSIRRIIDKEPIHD